MDSSEKERLREDIQKEVNSLDSFVSFVNRDRIHSEGDIVRLIQVHLRKRVTDIFKIDIT